MVPRLVCRTVAAIALCGCGVAGAQAQSSFDALAIHAGPSADEIERRCVSLLAERFSEWSIPISLDSADTADSLLHVHIGTLESYPALAGLADKLGVAPPAPIDPGAEGFVIASRRLDGSPVVLAIGSDRRGVLYAAGEILRQMEPHGTGFDFPDDVTKRCAPRWPVRGLIVSQGHTMRELTGAREWTTDELRHAYLDYALAGANTFEIGATDRETFDFLKSYGLDTLTVVSGNAGDGPLEWQAKEAIGRTGYLSPAIPEARARLIELREALFRQMPAHDYVHIKSGDGGGDESEAAAPYGGTLIRLCEDYARILHKYHPNTKLFMGNQKLDNAGEQAIFDFVQEKPREWLAGIVYGPGSNAMGWTPGRRQDHRTDLFEYARRGALSGYLREMLHQLPPRHDILLFTDLTHWVYSQYGLMDHELIADRNYATPPRWDFWMYERRPDDAMAQVYDRRTFHARPRNYYHVFQETAEFTIGDVAYSEGHHDHLNTWIYQRLFWDPHQSVEDVVLEYARTHFGPEAAPAMAEAIFQLEENLQTPISDNYGIERMIELVEQAGHAMPPERMARDYLWRMYAQRVYLDKHIQLDVRRQRAYYDDTVARLGRDLKREKVSALVDDAASLQLPAPSSEMAVLKERATKLSDESDRIFGMKDDGLFNLDHDYFGFGWLKRGLERAARIEDGEARLAAIRRIVHYEDPGEGGFYDNAGTPGGAPRLVYGWPYGDGGFSGANRPSQRTMAFTTDEERGVTFRYTDLDPQAQYRVRLTLVRPVYLPRFGMFQHQTSQSIMADDVTLAEDVELPEFESDFFEYGIPRTVTQDGELVLWMKKQPGIGEGLASDVSIWRNTGGWGTLVSEVWLIKSGVE
jgi:hypothetical protein